MGNEAKINYDELAKQISENRDNPEKLQEIVLNAVDGVNLNDLSPEQVKRHLSGLRNALVNQNIDAALAPVGNTEGQIAGRELLFVFSAKKGEYTVVRQNEDGTTGYTTYASDNMLDAVRTAASLNPNSFSTGTTRLIDTEGHIEYAGYDLGNITAGDNPGNNSRETLNAPFTLLDRNQKIKLDYTPSVKSGEDPLLGNYSSISQDLDYGNSFKLGDKGAAINLGFGAGYDYVVLSHPTMTNDGKEALKLTRYDVSRARIGAMITTPKLTLNKDTKTSLQGFAGMHASAYRTEASGKFKSPDDISFQRTDDGNGQASAFGGGQLNIGSDNNNLQLTGYAGQRLVPDINVVDGQFGFQPESIYGARLGTHNNFDIGKGFSTGLELDSSLTRVGASGYSETNLAVNAEESIGYRNTELYALQRFETNRLELNNGGTRQEQKTALGGGANRKLGGAVTVGAEGYHQQIGANSGYVGFARLGLGF